MNDPTPATLEHLTDEEFEDWDTIPDWCKVEPVCDQRVKRLLTIAALRAEVAGLREAIERIARMEPHQHSTTSLEMHRIANDAIDLCVICRKPKGGTPHMRLSAMGDDHGWVHIECAKNKNGTPAN